MPGAQVLGSMLVYPNRMSFDIMPNGGQPPTPMGLLHIRVVDVDVASGGLPIPHLHKARHGFGWRSVFAIRIRIMMGLHPNPEMP